MPIASPSSKLVIVLGAGPGTGYSIAKRFFLSGHPVALLARRDSAVQQLAADLTALSPTAPSPARGYGVDATSPASLQAFFARIRTDFPHAAPWGAVYNAGAFHLGPFLSTPASTLSSLLDVTVLGAFQFGQEFLRCLEAGSAWKDEAEDVKGFMAFSGASASVRGSASASAFGAAKAGLRSLSQSIAREYGPKGVHVFHVVLDGAIDTEALRSKIPAGMISTFMQPEDIAEVYYHTAMQRKSAWTQEVDLRPYNERF